jgi:Ca-activated chloride channel family protein
MRNSFDEVQLTAYALGELSERERAEVEARLAESEDVRRELEEIQATVAVLRETLAGEPHVELSAAQRQAVEQEARRARVVRFPIVRMLMRPASLAAAASLVLVALVTWRVMRTGETPEARVSPSAVANPAVKRSPLVAENITTPTPIAAATPAPRSEPRRATTSPDHVGGPSARAVAPVATPPPAEVLASPVPASSTSPTPPVVSTPMVASTGTITGTLVDPSGAVIPNASVTLTNEATGEVFPTFSDARGVFLISGLPPGAYSAKSEMPGFKTLTQTQIALRGRDRVDLAKIVLPVAAMTETIVVTTAPVALDASTASMGMVISSKGSRRSKTNAPAPAKTAQAVAQPVAQPVAPPPPQDQSALLDAIRARSAEFTTEAYDHIRDNPFILVSQDPRSTFSVDVDTASYSIMRRFLSGGELPPKDAVRIEELVNYFRYDYAPPTGPHPFAVHMETASCPWKPDHRLVRIGIKGRELARDQRPPSNLVFLLDVSGSMDEPNKLPLVQAAMRLLVNELGPEDRVAIVVYAGAQGLALPSTPASDKAAILGVLDRLRTGGTTHGSAGLKLAYETAEQSFIKGGVNRVILATDGDFNVGITNQADLIRLIEEKAKSGVFLTALGFGMGNLNDSTLEKLADHGNGNYAYIDTLWEARKVLVQQMSGTLVTIAKDVKLQLEFNPSAAKAFRLIGYENRVLAHQDFNDDKKDAGDIGAGHTVTALYEVVPAGGDIEVPGVDPLKYQEPTRPSARAKSDELLTLKLRYKQPDGDRSTLMEVALKDDERAFEGASTDFRFAAAVASFGMILRDSPYKGSADFAKTLQWAKASLAADEGSLRAEFVTLVEKARQFSRSN